VREGEARPSEVEHLASLCEAACRVPGCAATLHSPHCRREERSSQIPGLWQRKATLPGRAGRQLSVSQVRCAPRHDVGAGGRGLEDTGQTVAPWAEKGMRERGRGVILKRL
jgi:hypothetical protein